MSSWDGESELLALNNRFGYSQAMLDDVDLVGSSVMRLSSTPSGLARVVADWVTNKTECSVGAALDLESLDPRGTLCSQDRQLWDTALENVQVSVDFLLHPEIISHLRDILTDTDNLYRRTRNALDSPLGPDGPLLLNAIRAAGPGGYSRVLTFGQWEDQL